ncbi:ComF family protein [Bacillus niameyensis]|uniref:ComF family protein n=1 Tax=Bacillus niameyensis TaxID=1522308 RepID=UPI0007833897|nr:ComF family protein [Bacillus niameyensis]
MNCLYCDTAIALEMSWRNLLFPTVQPKLCESCDRKLLLIGEACCESCSRPLKNVAPKYIKENKCLDCIKWEQDPNWTNTLEKNISLFQYNDFLKEVVARFKFRGDYELAKIFSGELQRQLRTIEYEMLVPIPLSKERLLERGFNQSEALGQVAGIETDHVLERIHSERQSKKTRKQRLSQQQIFRFCGDKKQVFEKNILLIDDIYTTGITLRHAAKVLKEAGAGQVHAITLARG